MFDFSVFRHEWTKSCFAYQVPTSRNYKVFVNGREVPVYTCRISAYPFNTWWPGHQRPVDQSEVVSYVNLVSDEAIEIAVEPLTKTAYERIMIKPYSKNVSFETKGNQIVFTLKENGGYVLELDDYHGLLYLFNNKPCPCPNPEEVTYYFDKGVHFPGKIVLNSNESVYVHKDALVYGCVFAENAENIRIFGNGILDDSCEERVSSNEYCEPYTNGNVKFYDCKNVRLEGVGFTNSAIWCINLFHCFDVSIDGINVFGQWRYNTDGMDIVNSQRVTVKNSFIHSFDDTVTVKGIDRYSFESNREILVEHCVLWCDWGRTFELGFETAAREYEKITFRDCDVLRGGGIVCDIQNGDCAEIHDVVFEDIRVEFECFYTPQVVQKTEGQRYDRQDEIAVAKILEIRNSRFREIYSFLGLGEAECGLTLGDPRYAGVHGIKVKDIYVYCDERIVEKYGTQCVTLRVINVIPTTEYRDITVENVIVNGEKRSKNDLNLVLKGCGKEIISIK